MVPQGALITLTSILILKIAWPRYALSTGSLMCKDTALKETPARSTTISKKTVKLAHRTLAMSTSTFRLTVTAMLLPAIPASNYSWEEEYARSFALSTSTQTLKRLDATRIVAEQANILAQMGAARQSHAPQAKKLIL